MKVWSSESPSIVEWCPIRDEARLFASANLSENPALTLSRFNFLGLTPTTEVVSTFDAASPFTSLSWSTHPKQDLGLLAAGHKDGSISLFSPSDKTKISSLSYHKADITCLQFNPTQTNVLLSVSSDNEISIWDVTNPENGKRCSAGASNRAVQGTITGVAWHNKPSLSSFFALCDSSGLCVVWDLRSNRSTHNFADSTFKSELSDIAFAPVNSTLLATASSDPRNSVVSLWDLRNTTQPTHKLHGHSSGVVKLAWSNADDRVLLSAGKDGNVLAWNIETGEQLSGVFENSSPVSHLTWSPHFHGAVLASNQTGTQLYSFADPSCGNPTKLRNVTFHQRQCGVDVAFDGRIFNFKDKSVHSFVHQEQIAEASDFTRFVEALEQNGMNGFVNEKIDSAESKTERELWEICRLAMSPDTFKQNALANIGIVASKFAEQLKPAEKLDIQSEGAATTSASLFGEAPADGDDPAFVFGAAQSADEEVFSEAFAPFRVLPKREKDEAGNMIAQALISGNLQDAIDCCFQSEKFADALLIASCGPQELFQMTRERYIRHDNSTLTRLISHISQDKLDNFVRYAKTKDWREIFAVLCNYAKDDFEKNAEFLGRRLITERNDYNAALICFVAAKQYDMVQQCLFQIYETVENKDTSSASVVLLILEKLCAMAGTKADEVVAPIAKTFLQHVIQSGHKDDAIRFVNAFPANSRLQELKAALTGQAISHQQSPQQQQQRRPYNPQQQQQPPIGVPNTFQPQQQPGMPPQPGVQQPQPQQPRPGPTGVFTPSMGPQHGPPPPGKAVPPPPPTGSQPTAAPNQYNRQGQYVSPPGAYNNPTFVPVSQPPLQSAGFQPQQQVRPPPPGPAPTQMTPPGSLHQGVQPPPPQASPVINAPPPAFMPQIVAPPTTPMMPNAGPAPGSFGGYPGAPSMGQQQPSQPSAPPPAAQPNINVPPPAPTVVMPQIQMPSVAPQPMMPTPGPQGVPVNAPPRMEAPPMAQPNINAPPPMTIVPPPVPMAGGQPQPGMPQMGQAPGMPYGAPQQARAAPAQAPPPPPKKSPEATIDEVPDSYRPLAEQLQALVQGIESRPNMNTANKKALQDAAAKLPFVYGLLRDEAVPEALATDIIQFIQKINGGDVAGANQIRKNAIVQHMSKCRDAVLIMNYISNAIR